MRLLVCNDLDDSILHKHDVRAWAQRGLWFARDHDVVVLADDPDPAFLRHVTALTGTDPATLTVHTVGPGRFDRRMFDPHSLLDDDFCERIAPDVRDVDEVVALWPSPAVAEFTTRLGVADRWPGAAFYRQNAVETLNSMGNFRAYAAAAGVPVADGTVVRTPHDARAATRRLLTRYDAVMVKKAHGGAGAGNQVVTRDAGLAVGHAGSRPAHLLDGASAVDAYWDERWAWASSDGRYPVVVERFVPGARSVYVEFHLDDAGVRLGELGELVFEDRALAKEVVPLRTLGEPVRSRLVDAAHRLAGYYQRLGHRGPCSADAVVTPAGEFTFTEVNAQYTGSTHLYGVIAHRVVDVWREPWRTVTQCATPAGWKDVDVTGFRAVLEETGLAYDPAARRGVLAVTPHIGDGAGGPLVFAVAHETPEELTGVLDRLGQALS